MAPSKAHSARRTVVTKSSAANALARVARRLYARGLVYGTSGNFSMVQSRNPLRIVMSSSGVAKGQISAKHFLEVDERGAVIGAASGKPSAETLLHVVLAQHRNAASILHTHSVWSTLLSERFKDDGGLWIEQLEMLKGLSAVETHEHREWIPILANDQDMTRLSVRLVETLKNNPSCHAVLLAGHGMYTWGASIEEAERHVEILEFLLEVAGRRMTTWP